MNIREEDFKEHGVSIEEMKPVFEEFKLIVRLYNCIGQQVFAYDPEKKNKNVPVLYGLIKGNHIYTMNDNIMSIAHRDAQEDMKLYAPNDFQLNSREAPVKYELFNGIGDIMEIVKNNKGGEEVNLVNYRGLNNIYYEFKRTIYEPKIIMGAGDNISSIKFKFNKLVLNIRNQSLIDCAVDICVKNCDVEVFNKINEVFFNFNKGMFNWNHKSYYHDDDVKIFLKNHTIAPSGYLKIVGDSENKFVELDRRKAYTKSTIDIFEVPVFSEFDIWKRYDCSKNDFNKMKDLILYLVRSKVKNLFLNRTYNLIYDKFLKYFLDVFEIIYYKIPSNVYKVNYKKLVDELWNLKLDKDEEQDKSKEKMIICINVGLLEKQSSTAKKSIVFSKMVDAFYYQEKYGGDINRVNEFAENVSEEDEVDETKHYVLNISDTKILKNGYKFIKEMILQQYNFDMNTVYETLIKNTIEIYSVKIDAFVIDKCNLSKAKELMRFGGDIGDWRNYDRFNFPSKPFFVKTNFLDDITEYENETGEVKDEWNTDEIIDKHVLNNRRLLIQAEFADSGKSYICKHMKNRNYKMLFVVHSNELGQQCGCEWLTINKFFGISYGDERLNKFDYSNYNVIVFDGIYFHNVDKWALIWDFWKNNPDKIVVATGDTNQLKNPESLNNVFSFERYINYCINLIF